MFTGVIQTVGHIQSLQKIGGDIRVSINVNGLPMHDVELGESIAVSGVCLRWLRLMKVSLLPMFPMKPCREQALEI